MVGAANRVFKSHFLPSTNCAVLTLGYTTCGQGLAVGFALALIGCRFPVGAGVPGHHENVGAVKWGFGVGGQCRCVGWVVRWV